VLFEDSNPCHVFLYEVYDDATALEAHRATAHFKKYFETTASMIAKRVARHMSPIAFNINARSRETTNIQFAHFVVHICPERGQWSA
jgi:hypothetical protein